MSKQLLDAGDIVQAKGQEFEVVTVSCQQNDKGENINFSYELITKADADANRKRNAEAAKREKEEADRRAKEAEAAEAQA